MCLAAVAMLVSCSSGGRLLFYPLKEHRYDPSALGLAVDDVFLSTKDNVSLHGWWLPVQDNQPLESSAPIVLFLHGNAENISTHIASVAWLPAQGVNVFLLDYRGYGYSQGTPRLPDIFNDVEAALAWLKHHHPSQPIFVLGQSIGAAIASVSVPQLQDRYLVKGLILDATLNRYQDAVQDILWRSRWGIIAWPYTWCLPDDYDPQDHIAALSPTPLLMFHSHEDPVIDRALGLNVYRAAGLPKRWVNAQGGHIHTFLYADMRRALMAFIRQHSTP